MTLSRQLLSIISLAFVAIFAGTFFIGVDSTRQYLNTQLGAHAQDTATSLGLSLTPHMTAGDVALMESMVDAIFDGGYYREVVVRTVGGQPLVDRVVDVRVDGVPAWFVEALPLVTPRASAEIMSGWHRGGTVTVMSHPGHAYAELWNSTVDTLSWCAAALAMAVALTLLALRIVLRPLRDIEGQALAIADREFPVIDRIPATRELAAVVRAMNAMSTKVESMLREQAAIAEDMRREAFADPLTGLGNRRAFLRDHERFVTRSEAARFGAVLLIRVGGLDEVNRVYGFEGGDALLARAGECLRDALAGEAATVARLGGAEFGVVLPDLDVEAVRDHAARIVEALGGLKGRDDRPVAVHVGGAFHQSGETPSGVRARADLALRGAQEQGHRAWQVVVPDAEAGGALEFGAGSWREVLESALAEGRIYTVFQPVRLADLTATFHFEALGRIEAEDGSTVPARIFLPMAARAGLAATLDRALVERVEERIRETPGAGLRFALNVSAASLRDAAFMAWIEARLGPGGPLAGNVSFELSEHTAASAPAEVFHFAGLLRAAKVPFGIDHFRLRETSLAYLRELKADYLKLDGSLVGTQDTTVAESAYIRQLVEIARGLDARIVAEFVESESQLEAVRALGVDAVQGFHVGKPGPLPG